MIKKSPPEVSIEFTSSESSISFASLVCTQKPTSPSQQLLTSVAQCSVLEDAEFEFSSVRADSKEVRPTNIPAAKTVSSTSNRVHVANHLELGTLLPPISVDRRIRAHDNLSNSIRKRRTPEKQKSLGQKLFSFAAPCRNCRAVETTPSIKQQSS